MKDTDGLVGGETSTAAAFESHLSVQTFVWTCRWWNPSLAEKTEARIGENVVISGSNGAPVLLDLPKPFPIHYLRIGNQRYLPNYFEHARFEQSLVNVFTWEDQAPTFPFPPRHPFSHSYQYSYAELCTVNMIRTGLG